MAKVNPVLKAKTDLEAAQMHLVGLEADAETAKIEQVIRGLTKRIIEGKLTREQALEQFGAWAAGQVQAFISAGRVVPPLDPTTIARKGSSIPLIDTGQLRQSITYEVRPG